MGLQISDFHNAKNIYSMRISPINSLFWLGLLISDFHNAKNIYSMSISPF